jgi:hypothetical protein
MTQALVVTGTEAQLRLVQQFISLRNEHRESISEKPINTYNISFVELMQALNNDRILQAELQKKFNKV